MKFLTRGAGYPLFLAPAQAVLALEQTAARRAIDDERSREARRILGALRNQAQAQAGKHIGTSCMSEGVRSNPVEVLLTEIWKLADGL